MVVSLTVYYPILRTPKVARSKCSDVLAPRKLNKKSKGISSSRVEGDPPELIGGRLPRCPTKRAVAI
jgi:hypothetical protein